MFLGDILVMISYHLQESLPRYYILYLRWLLLSESFYSGRDTNNQVYNIPGSPYYQPLKYWYGEHMNEVASVA